MALINGFKRNLMTRQELIKKVESREIRTMTYNGKRYILYVNRGELFRYPHIGDPSKAMGVLITNEEIKSL